MARWVVVRVAVPVLLILVINSRTSNGADDPFGDEPKPCTIKIDDGTLKSLSKTMQTTLQCDGSLWGTVLVQFQHTRESLSSCLARAGADGNSEPSRAFCQVLLDDAQRQMEQERRQHGALVDEKLQKIQHDVLEHKKATAALGRDLANILNQHMVLYLELLLTNIGVGESAKALHYYKLVTRESKNLDWLHQTVVQSTYREAKHQNLRVVNLLEFIRRLSGLPEKLKLYELLKREVMKRSKQRDTHIAVMVGLDARKLLEGAPPQLKSKHERLHKDLVDPIQQRWKDQIMAGNFSEAVRFAENYPEHFELLQSSLVSFDAKTWLKLNFDKLVTYPNSLPLMRHRFAAFQGIMKQILDRNRNNSHNYLVKVAAQIDICDKYIKSLPANTKFRQGMQGAINKFKLVFPQYAGRKYLYYLKYATG